jgi:hypothetical protein
MELKLNRRGSPPDDPEGFWGGDGGDGFPEGSIMQPLFLSRNGRRTPG